MVIESGKPTEPFPAGYNSTSDAVQDEATVHQATSIARTFSAINYVLKTNCELLNV
jgi:hypothetical protein